MTPHEKLTRYYIPGGYLNIAVIVAAGALVSFFHHSTPGHFSSIHLAHYYLFYVIVIYAGFTFGIIGGAASSIILSLIYGPHVYLGIITDLSVPHDRVRILVEIIMIYTVGVIAGVSSQMLYRENKKLKRSYELLEEHTEARLRMEKELSRDDRLRMMGQLSAGIAHEIRNPLAAITSAASILKKNGPNDKLLDILMSEAERLNSFVTRFVQYARFGKRSSDPVDMSRFSAEVVELGRLMLKDSDTGELILDMDMPVGTCVRGDVNLLKQAFLGIISNGLEAVSDDGRTPRIVLAGCVFDGMVEFTITDNGPGIGIDQPERLFEPFFTTKAAGTGLGLTIAARIIREHGGSIHCENITDGGARFTVRLPVDESCSGYGEDAP